MRVNVSIDNRLLVDFDKYCEGKRYSRSELLSKLMRDVVYSLHNGTTPTENKIVNTGTISVKDVVDKVGWEYCQCHWEQTKGKTYPVKLITYEDENGFAVKDKKLACPDCILKYQNMGRGKLYYL